MPTTIIQIDDWRSAKSETETLEFKEAKTQFDFEDLSTVPMTPDQLHRILGEEKSNRRKVSVYAIISFVLVVCLFFGFWKAMHQSPTIDNVTGVVSHSKKDFGVAGGAALTAITDP